MGVHYLTGPLKQQGKGQSQGGNRDVGMGIISVIRRKLDLASLFSGSRLVSALSQRAEGWPRGCSLDQMGQQANLGSGWHLVAAVGREMAVRTVSGETVLGQWKPGS